MSDFRTAEAQSKQDSSSSPGCDALRVCNGDWNITILLIKFPYPNNKDLVWDMSGSRFARTRFTSPELESWRAARARASPGMSSLLSSSPSSMQEVCALVARFVVSAEAVPGAEAVEGAIADTFNVPSARVLRCR